MTNIEICTFRGEWSEAEVTMCAIGAAGFHVHSIYDNFGEPSRHVGLCGDAATLGAAQLLYEQSKQLAQAWAKAH